MADLGIIFLRRKHTIHWYQSLSYNYYRKYAVPLFLGPPYIHMYDVLCRRASPFKPLGFWMSLLFLKFIFAHVKNVSIVQLFSRINKLSIQFTKYWCFQKCFVKFAKLQSVITSLFFNRFSSFSLFCLKFLSSEIKLNLFRISPLREVWWLKYLALHGDVFQQDWISPPHSMPLPVQVFVDPRSCCPARHEASWLFPQDESGSNCWCA